METLFFVGVGLFCVGLVLSHVVLFTTRGAARQKKPISKKQRALMWLAVVLVVAGLALGGAGFLFGRR